MKRFLAFFLMFSSMAWAQGGGNAGPADRGGQNGSGGNICYIKDYSYCSSHYCWHMTGYRLVEEIQYPYLANPPSMVWYYPKPLKLFISQLHPEIKWTDLTATKAGQRVRKLLFKAFKFDTELRNHMLGLFDLLKRTHVVERRFMAPYDVSLEVRSLCVPSSIQAAIRTNLKGVMILSSTAWHKLPIESQATLLVHETLRFAQLFTNWFGRASNKELQWMTMLISQGKTTPLRRSAFYREFLKEKSFYKNLNEEKLATLWSEACDHQSCPSFPEKNLSPDKLLKLYQQLIEVNVNRGDYASAVKMIFAKARLMARAIANPEGERFEQVELDKLRINSLPYRHDIEQEIIQEFALTPSF